MNITLTRYRIRKETIDGRLSIDGIHICDTAENPIGSLPPGTYQITLHKCLQYSRKMPVVVDCLKSKVDGQSLDHRPSTLDIKPSTIDCTKCPKLPYVCNNTTLPKICPMLKVGNGVYHREDGSIILGEYIAPGCLKKSKEAFDTIYDRIRKTIQRGNQVSLTIKEQNL